MQETQCLVHMDLKGFPPTPERLYDLISLVRDAGFTGILFEFSDMFPWECDTRFRNETAYPEEVLSGIFTRLKKLGLSTAIHLDIFHSMEFMLGTGPYRYLSFSETGFDRINPSAIGSRNFLEQLVDDLYSLFPEIDYFSLGGFYPEHQESLSVERYDREKVGSFINDLVKYISDRGTRILLGTSILHSLNLTPDHGILTVSARTSEQDQPPGHSDWHAVWLPVGECGACIPEFPDFKVSRRTGNTLLMFPTRLTHHSPQLLPFEILLASLSAEIPESIKKLSFQFRVLSETTGRIWREIRVAREHLVLITRDPRRRHAHDLIARVNYLSGEIEEARKTGEYIVSLLEGLTDSFWNKRFLSDTLNPVSEELMLIRSRIPSVTE